MPAEGPPLNTERKNQNPASSEPQKRPFLGDRFGTPYCRALPFQHFPKEKVIFKTAWISIPTTRVFGKYPSVRTICPQIKKVGFLETWKMNWGSANSKATNHCGTFMWVSLGIGKCKGHEWPGTSMRVYHILTDLRKLNAVLKKPPAHWVDSVVDARELSKEVPPASTHSLGCDISDAFSTCKPAERAPKLCVVELNGCFFMYLGGP